MQNYVNICVASFNIYNMGARFAYRRIHQYQAYGALALAHKHTLNKCDKKNFSKEK